jgi:hypothetical protein
VGLVVVVVVAIVVHLLPSNVGTPRKYMCLQWSRDFDGGWRHSWKTVTTDVACACALGGCVIARRSIILFVALLDSLNL